MYKFVLLITAVLGFWLANSVRNESQKKDFYFLFLAGARVAFLGIFIPDRYGLEMFLSVVSILSISPILLFDTVLYRPVKNYHLLEKKIADDFQRFGLER